MIHVQEVGSGKPVVFLHGLFGSGENLAGLGRRLPDGYRALLTDLPSHGRSEWSSDMRSSHLAAILAEQLRPRLDQPAVFVGHSLGGKAAMALALQEPDLVAGLAVLDIAPVTYPDRHSELLAALLRVQQAQPQDRSQADEMLQTEVSDPLVRGFLLKNFDPDTVWRIPVATLEEQYDVIRGWDLDAAASAYSGPAVCIYGSESGYLDPARHASELKQLFPGIELVPISGAGHWLHATHLQETSRELNRFILSVG